MNDVVHNVGSPALVVQKVASGPNAGLFKQVYMARLFSRSPRPRCSCKSPER
jgi:hypothetical protein